MYGYISWLAHNLCPLYIGVEADEMSKGPPPEYAPESDTRPLIVAEQHPQPLGPRPFGNIQVSSKHDHIAIECTQVWR